MESSEDKQWAKRYILDPLTAPEPSQETGPGSSFINPLRRAASTKAQESPVSRHRKTNSTSSYPTPPASASPTQSSFHPSNPFGSPHRYQPLSPKSPPASSIPLGRSNSISRQGYQLQETYYPQSSNSSLGRSKTVHHHHTRHPPQTHQTQGSTLSRSVSVNTGSGLDKGKGLQRSGSLSGRYPGDMSHRPLAMLKRDQRAADRAPTRARKFPNTDTIDSLDSTSFGGAYHHGGPYDATLASRNGNKMYSPVEALKDSNMEALRATPREYIQDSLIKHVPLQGTATVPPGMTDLRGDIMNYEEGADLMRERDAPGGAYKRYDFISYRDDDFKGKGEPSFTIERDYKEHKARLRKHGASNSVGEYEMQPHANGTSKGASTTVRQRSVSAAGAGPSAQGPDAPMFTTSPNGVSTTNDIRRSNTTGKKFGEGLKRRFGSLRRKKHADED